MALLEHLRIDPTSALLLERLVGALLSQIERSSLVGHGDETFRPWEVLTDPATAPLWALPYAAQWTGGRMPPRLQGEDDVAYTARARHEVVYPRGMLRGSAATVLQAVREQLTGNREVIFRERFGGDPWLLMIVTRESETSDQDAVHAAAYEVLPAGISLNLEHRNARDWAEIMATWGEWDDVLSDNADWQEVLEVSGP
jgi:hypothetical protein